MASWKERVKKAVVRIATTRRDEEEEDVTRIIGGGLPLLERSLLPILTLASAVHTCGIFIRRLLYQFHVLHQTRLPIPVMSVGNMTWGGTGKTPMVEYLAHRFLSAGLCPLILTRGYGGGDEVRLLQKHLQGTSAKFGVGPNRALLALSILHQQAVQNGSTFGADWSKQNKSKEAGEDVGIVILDDGMQHLSMARDIDIVMVNVVSGLGNGRIVPRGPLREPLQGFKRAQVVVLHHADLVTEQQLRSLRGMLDHVLGSGTIVIGSRMRPHNFYKVDGNSNLKISLEAMRDAVVLCVSGIGCPESLALILQQEGALHVERLDFSDHHRFDAEDLKEIRTRLWQLHRRFKEHTVLLVMSEKDYMRDSATMAQLSDVGALVLQSSLEIISGYGDEYAFDELLVSVAAKHVSVVTKTHEPVHMCSDLKAIFLQFISKCFRRLQIQVS
ncbi:unnamed protein product [Sphagnum jensenii]|uniref:tetraacyldisaccharide 4'-kinase n=1 Tax=Sphagnum jensenii TaxID=128206 RepID=A0ABP1B182_9BRYO